MMLLSGLRFAPRWPLEEPLEMAALRTDQYRRGTVGPIKIKKRHPRSVQESGAERERLAPAVGAVHWLALHLIPGGLIDPRAIRLVKETEYGGHEDKPPDGEVLGKRRYCTVRWNVRLLDLTV
jgi:hypothetical protein